MTHTDDITDLAIPATSSETEDQTAPAAGSPLPEESATPEVASPAPADQPNEPGAETTLQDTPLEPQEPELLLVSDELPAEEQTADPVSVESAPAVESAAPAAAAESEVPDLASETTTEPDAAEAAAPAGPPPDAQEEPAPRVLSAAPPRPAEPAVPPRLARFGGPLETPASLPTPRVTVIQPLTPLKDVELPKRPVMPEDERRLLHTWNLAMERALRDDRPADAVRLAHPVLRQLPRHLATYYRLVRAAWSLRRWDEGDTWGRRLLRADPSNALAWRAVAMAVEQRGERARAAARWQRAFESDPYEPEVRAGLVRTSLDLARLPQLNHASLGSLLLRGFRWEQAVAHFERLMATDGRRLDFQSSLLLALWQNERPQQAYELARRLVQAQPYLLIAWVVIDEVGDDNDKALARHPLSTMDPDGDYVRSAWGLSYPSRSIRLTLTDAEKALIESHMQAQSPV